MSQATVKISSSPRGNPSGTTQAAAVFVPAQVVATWAWGLQPATALIDWVSAQAQPAIVAGSSLQIDVGGHTFYGFTDNVVTRVASDGFSLMQEFKDNRDYLMWDVVYCAFNLQDNKIVDGQYIQRFKHLLPGDFNAGWWSYSNSPYTAHQIMDLLFNARTVETAWVRTYHALMDNPVYDLDFTSGVKLGQALVDISERLGLVFTLMGGPTWLVWALKGVGTLPGFPANSENRRLGTAVSGNPTRLRVLGDRNVYQCLDCPLEADWLPAWQNFWDFNAFINDIFWNESTEATIGGIAANTRYSAIPGDVDQVIGYSLAGARARLLTVAQYARMRDRRLTNGGAIWRDFRRFQGRSRLNMPVSLYLSQIMFRAFRLPDAFRVRMANGEYADKYAFNLVGQALVEVTHNPVTGAMTAVGDGYGHYDVPSSDHNGYAIVQGFQVAQDAFKTLRPEYFNLNQWVSGQAIWQATPFQIDDSGAGDQFVLFDEPVIQSGDLIRQPAIAGAVQVQTNGQPCAAVYAGATLVVPPVRASLVFAGDKFSYVVGSGTRDDVVNVSSLNGQFLTGFMMMGNGTSRSRPDPGARPVELPYANGLTASQKADSYARVLLNGQFYYINGGYTVQGSNATQIDGLLDRVTIRWGADGLTEEVEFTSERSRNVTIGPGGVPTLQLEPEREFDRRSQLAALFSGQQELRQQANQLRMTAMMLRGNPVMRANLVDTFHRLMGLDATAVTALVLGGQAGNFGAVPVGTPLFREGTGTAAIWPNGTTVLGAPVFIGITVVDGEASAGGVRATAVGDGGIVQTRVRLLAAEHPPLGAVVGLGVDKKALNCLVLSPGTIVGTLMDDWSANLADRVVLTRVKLGSSPVAPTAGVGWNWRGAWLAAPTEPYQTNDVVELGAGMSAGGYRSTIDNNANMPDSGIGWNLIYSICTWL